MENSLGSTAVHRVARGAPTRRWFVDAGQVSRSFAINTTAASAANARPCRPRPPLALARSSRRAAGRRGHDEGGSADAAGRRVEAGGRTVSFDHPVLACEPAARQHRDDQTSPRAPPVQRGCPTLAGFVLVVSFGALSTRGKAAAFPKVAPGGRAASGAEALMGTAKVVVPAVGADDQLRVPGTPRVRRLIGIESRRPRAGRGGEATASKSTVSRPDAVEDSPGVRRFTVMRGRLPIGRDARGGPVPRRR